MLGTHWDFHWDLGLHIQPTCFRYCGLDQYGPSVRPLLLERVIVANAKDPEKDGSICYNDSGSALFLKKGNRNVQIGMT